MNTLNGNLTTAVHSCVPTKLSLDRLGYAGVFAAVCEAWLLPSEVTDEAQHLPQSSILLLKAVARQDTHAKSLPAVIRAPSRTVLFPDAEQRQE